MLGVLGFRGSSALRFGFGGVESSVQGLFRVIVGFKDSAALRFRVWGLGSRV